MLKLKQATIDANEHFKSTIIKDEEAFGLTDFSERQGVKSPTHLFEQRKRDEKANYIRDGVKQIDAMEKQASLEIRKLSEKDAEELFERKYGSKIEKIDETMGTIKSSLDEMKEAKKQKALDKQKLKEDLEKAVPKLSQANNSAINIQTPTPQTNNNNTSNQPTHISHQPIPPINSNPNRIPKIPNYRNLFRK